MILGAIIGDVVGSIYEFNNIKTKEFKLFTSGSTFTDDTVMTLAVASALRKWKKGETIKDKDFTKAVIEAMKFFGKKSSARCSTSFPCFAASFANSTLTSQLKLTLNPCGEK